MNVHLLNEVIWCLSFKLNKIREAEKDSISHLTQTGFQATWVCAFSRTNPNQKDYWLSSIYVSPSPSPFLLITHRRQCQGRKFCPHHYLLITMFVQARSAGGNRWCVWQCVQHQACSALVRVDICPDHKAQTCIQVTDLCLTQFKMLSPVDTGNTVLKFKPLSYDVQLEHFRHGCKARYQQLFKLHQSMWTMLWLG